MTDLASVLKAATRVRGLRIMRRQSRDRLRRLLGEADRARDRKDWPEASRLYQQVLELDPLQYGIRVQLGHAYKELGDLANAGLCYRGALQLAPDDDDLYLQIGHLEKIKGDLPAAALAYRKSAELNPRNGDAAAEYSALAADLALPPLPNGAAASVAAHAPAFVNGSAHSPLAASLHERAAAQELRDRGDEARDDRRWREAADAYDAYLTLAPDDFAIWVQLGHALKESGDPLGAEDAYRSAVTLAPDDADVHLQLGHVLKLRGQPTEAADAYRRSFDLHPLRGTWCELAALDRSAAWRPLRPSAPPQRAPEILLDISDLLIVLRETEAVSGIQRVQLGLLANAVAASDVGCRFVIWRDRQLWLLPSPLLAALVPDGSASPPGWQYRKQLIAEIEAQAVLYAPVTGDAVVSTGVIYFEPDLAAQRQALKRAGVKLGAYFHDFIPLTHPEFCAEILIDDFCKTASDTLPHLDFVLTVSEHVASEARRLLRQAGFPSLPVRTVRNANVSVVPRGSPDAAHQLGGAVAALRGRDYVLCVGTLSVHKNQRFLVQVWDLLVREGHEPPLLVLAGTRNYGADEVVSMLARSRNVDGRVVVIDKPSDAELAFLYGNCLFTMFPSLVEGWGLPIGESLAHGKLCVASREASLPEVGGEHVLYIDPYNVRASADLVRDLSDNRDKIGAHERRLAARFEPRGWDRQWNELVAAIRDEVGSARSEGSADARGSERPRGSPAGAVLRPRRISSHWQYGKELPPYAETIASLEARSVLVRGWLPSESWGTWIDGRFGQILLPTTEPRGSLVTILLQCRTVPWLRRCRLQVTSACGAALEVPIPEVAPSEAAWRKQRYPELTCAIDCTVAEDGSVELSLEVAGPDSPAWGGEPRTLSAGLVRLAYLPAKKAGRALPPNRRIHPGAWCSPSGETASPAGLQSLLAIANGSRMLAAGWRPPGPSGAWLAGAKAELLLATEAVPGETVRVLLQLRTGAEPVAVPLTVSAGCGAAQKWRLPGDSAAELVWLDCIAGPDGEVRIALIDETFESRFLSGRVGLVSVAYGCRGTVEDRLALTEAMLYPLPDERTAFEQAVAAELHFAVVGHVRGSYSLAAINRSLAIGLDAACPGRVRIAQIETDPVRDLSGVPAGDRDPVTTLAARVADPAAAEVAIVQHWPVLPPPDGCDLPLALFAWEEGLVPRDIVEHLNRHYRGVLAQTRAVAKALLDSGVAVPVHVVGCAIDLSRFAALGERRATARPRAAIDNENPFVFLHLSSCFPRKGVDVLLAAYAEAFRRGDPVRLVIKGFPNPHNDAARQIAELRAADPDMPAIELIERDLDEEEVLRLYEAADAMVLPSRGEGFNMPAAEAMAAGLPLIVTAGSGHADFVRAEVARTLDYEFAPSNSHVAPAGSVWLEPDKTDLVAALRDAVANPAARFGGLPSEQQERARRAVVSLGDRAAWGRRVAHTARALLSADPHRFVTVGWISTWQVRCGIAEYSHHLLSRFDQARRDVRVFCDARTKPKRLDRPGRPRAQVAWHMHDEASIDELAAAIERADVEAVVVQHHDGFLEWPHLSRLLRDGRLARRPVVVFVHHVRYLFQLDPGQRADAVDALRLAARVLVHSIGDLNVLKSLGLVDNVTLFPHGAERTDLAPRPVRSFAAGERPLIGAYGFFLPPKGFDRLIRALPALLGRWGGLRLRLVTAEYPDPVSADEIARCKELARSLGIAPAIEWITDYLPNRRSLELLNECDLIVLPYHDTTESASGASRVALASRAPVAVTPIRIFDELEKAVLRFDSGEPADIAAGIAAMLGDPGRRQQAIEAAGQWLAEHDWTLLAARLQGILAGLVATARTTP